jgi:hypothetical protein
MKSFIRTQIVFFIPFIGLYIFLLIFYYVDDPFRINRSYKQYFLDGIEINRDYISSQYFLENFKSKQYNSFVFGSSRSICVNVEDWKGFMDKGNTPYHFDVWGENIYGIYTKIHKMDSLKVPLKHALIFLCMDKTFGFTSDRTDSYLYRKHPYFANSTEFDFHKLMLSTYLNLPFCLRYVYWKSTHSYSPFLEGYILQHTSTIDGNTNQVSRQYYENLIHCDSAKYYQSDSPFWKGGTKIKFNRSPVIHHRSKEMLEHIAAILKSHHTNYKIIISPIYGGQKINADDLNYLQSIFSEVYDFTGDNVLSHNPGYYYDMVHPRRMAGKYILDSIYSSSNQNTCN